MGSILAGAGERAGQMGRTRVQSGQFDSVVVPGSAAATDPKISP